MPISDEVLDVLLRSRGWLERAERTYAESAAEHYDGEAALSQAASLVVIAETLVELGAVAVHLQGLWEASQRPVDLDPNAETLVDE